MNQSNPDEPVLGGRVGQTADEREEARRDSIIRKARELLIRLNGGRVVK